MQLAPSPDAQRRAIVDYQRALTRMSAPRSPSYRATSRRHRLLTIYLGAGGRLSRSRQ